MALEPSRRELLKSGALALLSATTDAPGWAYTLRIAQTPEKPAHAMRFGLNYVPRKNWWYAWDNWDKASISEDLHAIRDLGMDHIRIQCLWPTFQPGINYVNAVVLDRLLELLNLAAEVSLDVQVTVLNGWLSGYSFLPAWVAPLEKGSNIFTCNRVINAEKLLFREIATRVGSHERFLGFDLGNEIDVVQGTIGNHATLHEADQWATAMLAELERLAPGKLHVNGVDHAPWLKNTGFSRSNLATTGKATIIHCYAYWSGALKRYRYDDAGNLHLLEFMIELAKAYHRNPERQVWVEEVGTSSEWMPQTYIPEYTMSILGNAATCTNVWGFTWWCSHDIDPAIKGFLNLEYSLGVLDLKNRVKPIGKTLAKFVEQMRRNPPQPLRRPTAIVIPDTSPLSSSTLDEWALVDRFMELVRQNHHPAFVLESRTNDELYLRARGIKNLIRDRG